MCCESLTCFQLFVVTVNCAEDINLSIVPEVTELEFHILPVDQGDCTFIQCPFTYKIVVVDCGSSGSNHIKPQQIEDYLGDSINFIVAIILTESTSIISTILTGM